jgi:RimJ/RimL family protein N-acetyltransferase
MVTEIEVRVTARLRLRRPTMDDVNSIVAIDSDPRTNLHRRGGAPSPGQNLQTFGEFIIGWEEHEVGYWIVEFGGDVIGMAGVEPQLFLERECWNLYYRLSPSAWGNGFAVEAAKEAMIVASSLQPKWPVMARTRATNYAAARTAENAGLRRCPELDTSGFEVFARGW